MWRTSAAFVATVATLCILGESIVRADYLFENDMLNQGNYLYSDDGQYRAGYTCASSTGNCALVQWQWNGSSWAGRGYLFSEVINIFASPRVGNFGGNIAMVDGAGYPYGMSNTAGSGNYLAVQNDGNIVVYDPYGTPLWTPRCEFPWISVYASLYPFDLNNCPYP